MKKKGKTEKTGGEDDSLPRNVPQERGTPYDPGRLVTPVMAVTGMAGADAAIVLPDAGGTPEDGGAEG